MPPRSATWPLTPLRAELLWRQACLSIAENPCCRCVLSTCGWPEASPWPWPLFMVSLGIGMAGYHAFEGLSWLDAFLNAAMILSGMGPVAPIQTTAGKLFAGCYALFSGLALITTLAVIVAPVFHRFLHRFHMEADLRDR